MCTYNGARHLPEQLESLVRQTRPPDEMVVCDDRSTDATREIIESFALTSPFPVHLYVNEQNLGSTKNFEKAIALCNGDIIALCDQDDVWREEKLRLTEAALRETPAAGLGFTDAELVDERLCPLGTSLWQLLEFDARKQKLMKSGAALELLLGANVVTGATLAFRSEYRELFLPIPPNIELEEGMRLIHDGWIALTIAAVAPLVIIPQPLVRYRQHPAQQLGGKGITRPTHARNLLSVATSKHVSVFQSQLRLLETLNERVAGSRFSNVRTAARLKDMMTHLRARLALPANKLSRVPVVVKELTSLRYHRYSKGLYSAMKDLLL